METITLKKVDEVFMHVDCDRGLARELFDFFCFNVPNAKFMPSVKKGWWDGKIRLFSMDKRQIYIGLMPYVIEFCKERGYEVQGIQEVLSEKDTSEHADFVKSLGLPFEPREYQLEAFNTAKMYGRQLLLSPTASGKSLIIYLLTRYFDKKTVIIVPTTSLVEQMAKDFEDYGYKEDICKIYSGQPVFDSPVTITTWQSFSKAPTKVIKSFDVVIGDEAHLFKANVCKGILEKMNETAVRIGTTGTLDGTEVHQLQLEGLFGPVKRVITTSELMESGAVANLKIDCIILKHLKREKSSYQDEMDYLVSCPERNAFIVNLVSSLKGNTLVLFQYVEKHGAVLHDMLQPRVKQLHYVHGSTDTEDREAIRQIVEQSDDHVILASYGTFSTGVNIKKIDNVIFASPSKSRIRNLQSIGRALRKSDSKTEAKLYDIADDLGCNNHTLKHLKDRVSIYSEEKFEYEIIQLKIQ